MFFCIHKRVCAVILILILLTAPELVCRTAYFVLPVVAQAEEPGELLHINLTARPDALVEPDDITLTFVIENDSDVDAQNVYISSADGLLSEPVGQVAAGESQSFNRQHSVTDEELEKGEITYIISHDDPNKPNSKVNYTVHAQIKRSDIKPQAEFTRQFSCRSVSSGGTLTVTYRVRNTGNVALRNLRIQDTLGDYTGRIDRLEVGQSRSLISRVTLTDAGTSSASLSFNADGEGEEIFISTLEDVSVTLAEAGMDQLFSVTYSPISSDTANALLLLYNTGNVEYRDLCITDEVFGGVIADGLVLPVGKDPLEIRHSYRVRNQGEYQWRITGISESGEALEILTKTVELTPEEGKASSPLSLSVEPLTPRIRRSGNVTLRVQIFNPGETSVEDIVLSEANLGDLRTFSVLGGGETIVRDVEVYVSENTGYNFSIRYSDQGSQQAVSALPVEVVIAADGALPDGARPPFIEFTGSSIKIGGSATFAVLLISGAVVLLTLIILLAVASRKVRIEKQLRIAAEKKRRKEQGKSSRAAKNKGKGRNS